MKLNKTASGKQTIKISRKEWLGIGKVAKWIDKKALNKRAFDEDEWMDMDGDDMSRYEGMGSAASLFDQGADVEEKRNMAMKKLNELSEEELDAFLDAEGISLDGMDVDENDEASIAAQEQIAAEEAALAAAEEAKNVEVDQDQIRQEYLRQNDSQTMSLNDLLDD